ncbi:MAG TPA: serpin family protein [Fimbriimonadaceae bacterium]|nr:serpin family protein [Fimbriimonadaceae bacterium]
MQTNLYAFLATLVPALLAGCTQEAPKPMTPRFSAEDVKQATARLRASAGLVRADNQFGFEVFRQLHAGEPQRNLLTSPTSIAIALTMTYNGARGETRTAMAKTLGLGNLSTDAVNAGNKDLRAVLLGADPKVNLDVANSLWIRQGYEIEKPFLDLNRTYFDAKITNLDFASPNAAETINDWVSAATRTRIPKIVDEIRRDSVMFLINAVYFKGSWQEPFEKEATQDGDFYSPNGKVTAKMMSQWGENRYAKGDGYQMVRLPYGDGRLGMTILLPDRRDGLSELIAKLDGVTWSDWTGKLRSKSGRVRIPRWRSEFDVVLNDTLGALGMGIAFDPSKADFTGMRAGGEMYIGQVRHKTFVDVNEEGTEAAAVTSVEMKATSAPAPEEPFDFLADRPFLYTIDDSATGAILFVGILNSPA